MLRKNPSAFLLGLTLALMAAWGIFVGSFSVRNVYENKLRDTWAILFLELDHEAIMLQQYLDRLGDDSPGSRRLAGSDTDIVLRSKSESEFEKVSGEFPDHVTALDLKLDPDDKPPALFVLSYGGKAYLARWVLDSHATALVGGSNPRPLLRLREADVASRFSDTPKHLGQYTVFAATREGSLVYSNDPHVTQLNYKDRPLVQRFITSSYREAQFELNHGSGSEYGFISEIPKSNMILFAEVSKQAALAGVRSLSFRFVWTLLLLLALSAPLLWYVVRRCMQEALATASANEAQEPTFEPIEPE